MTVRDWDRTEARITWHEVWNGKRMVKENVESRERQ